VDVSVALRILGFMYNKKVSSYHEMKSFLHESGKRVSASLYYLVKTRKLKRLPFSTKWGKIVYLPDVKMKQVWKYCYDNDLIPPTTKLFFQKISEQRCVSTIELYEMGLDIADVRFFIDTFTKQWKLIKIARCDNFNVFYTDKKDLEEYMANNQDKLLLIQQKEWKRKQEEGKNFEEMIEKFYQHHGFQTQRNMWFSTQDKEKVEVDILAKKQFFPQFDNFSSVLIAVQCKSWRNSNHFYTLTEFLKYYCKLKQVLPSCLFHIWSYNYSKYFFKPSLCKRFPDVRFYYSKHIREAFKISSDDSYKISN